MTGYESKRAAAQDKLAQPEPYTVAWSKGYEAAKAESPEQAYESAYAAGYSNGINEGYGAGKAYAAAQPAQEPWRESASDYERGVIDGRQMQAQSSVDKAVNAMTRRTWVDLTDDEISDIAINNPPAVHEFARAVLAKSKEKNNG